MEWTVVTVIGTIVALFLAVGAPIIKQTKMMAKLDASIESLTDKFSYIEQHNEEEHKKIWEKNDEQDEELHKHEVRIVRLEEHHSAKD